MYGFDKRGYTLKKWMQASESRLGHDFPVSGGGGCRRRYLRQEQTLIDVALRPPFSHLPGERVVHHRCWRYRERGDTRGGTRELNTRGHDFISCVVWFHFTALRFYLFPNKENVLLCPTLTSPPVGGGAWGGRAVILPAAVRHFAP